MLRRWMTAAIAAAVIVAAVAPVMAADRTQAVVVLNNTRFEPLAHDLVIRAGESARFETRSGGFGRVSLLVAGTTVAGATGDVKLITLYGPPVVPAGPPRPLPVDPDGNLHAGLVEPVLGPAMSVVVRNDTASDVTLSLSVYLAQ